MHQLIIKKLGPIRYCSLSIKQYTVLTGYQASGKSTIAKAVYLFCTLKEDIYQLILRREFSSGEGEEKRKELVKEFMGIVRGKFLNTFGTSYSMDRSMRLEYHYTEDTFITIRLKEGDGILSSNYVWIDYSNSIRAFLQEHDSVSDSGQIRQELSELFDDPYETVYIPAGRSILTVLGGQFNYLYSTMDDTQKRLLDSCTRDYLERVMKLRPQFSDGLEGLLEGQQLMEPGRKLYQEMLSLTKRILKGRYTVSDGEERIWVDGRHYVKMNFASSGQQEIVWILNLLFYYLALKKQVLFIIEEPESNLFPESQKWVVELISMVIGAGNALILTTHSPYVLGTVNNLLYAGVIGPLFPEKVSSVISSCKWIDFRECTALFVENGRVADCMDAELKQIDNSLLDQISHGINREYDELFAIEHEIKEKEECH